LKNQELFKIGTIIEERKHELAKKVKGEEENEEAIKAFEELYQLFADGLKNGKEETVGNVTEWGKRIGNLSIEYGGKLDEALKETSTFRDTLWDAIERIMKEGEFSQDTVFRVARTIDPLLDEAVYAFSTEFVNSYKETLDNAQEEFLKLSAPVVPIYDGVAVLPIIGNVDENRAYYLMDTTLKEATKRQLSYLLIDLSGVAVVDTMVANSIYNIIHSLELVGVKAILAGIRPEVAHTMVSLGINFSEIQTYNSLQQALSTHVFE